MILTSTNASIVPDLANTHRAATSIARASDEQKLGFLESLSLILIENKEHILKQNQLDLDAMELNDPKRDRLLLNDARIESLSKSLLDVAKLPDPANIILLEKTLANGIFLQKKAVPIGVIGVIFEARPNVTIDVTALCIRSGNAVVLKGGSDAHFSNIALVSCIEKALIGNSIDQNVVLLLPSGREFVKEMLEATRYVDVIIPRGSESLIKFVREHSKVPTIETGAGVCHTYVHAEADFDMAKNIVVNAKTTRVSVCNSLDTLLVDKDVAQQFLPMLIEGFTQFNVEVFADEMAFDIFKKAGFTNLQKASESDFGREFLDFKCSVKVVAGIDEALNHIAQYSSKHSEAIVSENTEICDFFINNVDAAAVYSNASTRFTDGGEFGLGAEIGISTQKLHARGPFALEKLVTEKWILKGNGQIR